MNAPQMATAFDAACLALLAMAARQLLRMESEGDSEIESLTVAVNVDGSIDVTLQSASGLPIGGHSL